MKKSISVSEKARIVKDIIEIVQEALREERIYIENPERPPYDDDFLIYGEDYKKLKNVLQNILEHGTLIDSGRNANEEVVYSKPHNKKNIKLFHGTSLENAEAIMEEGFVLGKHKTYRTSPDDMISAYFADDYDGVQCGFDYAVLNAQAAAAVQDSQKTGVAVITMEIPEDVLGQIPDDAEDINLSCETATKYLTGYYIVHDVYSPGTRLTILAHMDANGKDLVEIKNMNEVDRGFLTAAKNCHEDFMWLYINSLDQDVLDISMYRFITKKGLLTLKWDDSKAEDGYYTGHLYNGDEIIRTISIKDNRCAPLNHKPTSQRGRDDAFSFFVTWENGEHGIHYKGFDYDPTYMGHKLGGYQGTCTHTVDDIKRWCEEYLMPDLTH